MVVINSAELRNNMKKYLDLARTERVLSSVAVMILFPRYYRGRERSA